MKLSPQWIRDFVDLTVDDRRLAGDLTNAGIAVEGISGEGKNTVFEMEIGTNRPDAMNHYGVAREAAAIYGLPLKAIQPALPGAKSAGAVKLGSRIQPGSETHPQSAPAFPVEIKDPQGCARFTARVLRGVSVKPSPAKIVERLALLDQRAINNAADATNYALWEMGKPTHVFDLDLLEGGRIIVRRARDGEKLKTLDGVERKLTAEDLVVADAVKPVGLAGTMGGFDTMITDKTRNILIESAWWDPVTVRKMSRRHGLHTDASHRFERGADFESTILSSDRVAELILQSGGGELVGDPVDVVARWLDQAPVGLRMSEVHRILGDSLDTNQVVRILQRLGFEVLPEPEKEPEFTVLIPSWRLDIEREIDLIEEIARLHGYDKFENTLPSFSGSVIETPDAAKDHKLRSSLLALGYDEAVSLTFNSHDDARDFCAVPVIEIANPLSDEASVMRTSLVPGMLTMLAYNLNRGNDNVRLFEAGSVFEAENAAAAELRRICMGASGSAVNPGVHQPARPFSFFDLKGDVETLLHLLQHDVLGFDSQTAEYYHPGRSARAVMDGVTVAQFGQLHPETAARRKFKQEVFIAELYLDRLYKRGLRPIRFEALPRFPAVERDFSFVFADAIVFDQIRKAVTGLHLNELRSFVPVEIFRGGAVPAGKYSLLLRAIFQSNERTLREDEVTGWSARVVKALEALGGTLRAS
ncbi:MAG: phenylalanine--tRNA ligase subunit beta [Terriglobales bacterium]